MAITTTRRFPVKKNYLSATHNHNQRHNRLNSHVINSVCKFWLVGKCTKNPCKFVHPDSPPANTNKSRLGYEDKRPKLSWTNPNYSKKPTVCQNPPETPKEVPAPAVQKNAPATPKEVPMPSVCENAPETLKEVQAPTVCENAPETPKEVQKMCKYWATGNCVQGDNCKDLHSWFSGSGFSMVAKLEGHTKAVTGIAIPSGSDKLYSGSKDKSLRVWDCNTGQTAGIVNFDCESGTLVSEGSWLFLGLPNAIKAWNIQTRAEFTFAGPSGQVHKMVEGNDMLFAGTEDGTILAWKLSSETIHPEPCASLKGHCGAVISLIVGANNRLYSGSMDSTIRVWDLKTLECVETLNGHRNDVTSLVCWASYLLSGSLDNTIKVWAATENGNLEVIYEHNEEHSVLAMCGIQDSETKPILLCSCKDNAVRLYDLPTFNERGRIFAKEEVRAIQIGPAGLFFTGDATGLLSVWKLDGDVNAAVS